MLHNQLTGIASPSEQTQESVIFKFHISPLFARFPTTILDIDLSTLTAIEAPPEPYKVTGFFKDGVEKSARALRIAKDRKDMSAIILATQELGMAFYFQASSKNDNIDHKLAKFYFNNALKMQYDLVNPYLTHTDLFTLIKSNEHFHSQLSAIADASHYLGRVHHELHEYEKAEACYSLEMKIHAALQSYTKSYDYRVSRSCLYMGSTYSALKNSPIAIKYYEHAIAVQRNLLKPTYWIIGKAYYESALEFVTLARLSLISSEMKKNEDGIYEYTPTQLKKADEYYLKAIEFLNEAVTIYSKGQSSKFLTRKEQANAQLKNVRFQHQKIKDLQLQLNTDDNSLTSNSSSFHILKNTSNAGKTQPNPTKSSHQLMDETKTDTSPAPLHVTKFSQLRQESVNAGHNISGRTIPSQRKTRTSIYQIGYPGFSPYPNYTYQPSTSLGQIGYFGYPYAHPVVYLPLQPFSDPQQQPLRSPPTMKRR